MALTQKVVLLMGQVIPEGKLITIVDICRRIAKNQNDAILLLSAFLSSPLPMQLKKQ